MIVTLENWYDQSIHCPFCGSTNKVDEPYFPCVHWLYTSYFEFLTRSKRFDEIAGLPSHLDDELSLQEIEKYGSFKDIINKHRSKFYNLVEFQLVYQSDISLIAFAPIYEE